MKLLVVSHSSELGGAERSMLEVVRAATARGHHVEVAIPGKGPLVDRLYGANVVQVHTTILHRWMSRRNSGLPGLVRLLQCVLDIPSVLTLMRKIQPDLVWVNSSVIPAPMLAASVLRIPLLIIVRESLWSNPSLRSVLPKHIIVWLIKTWADYLIAVSDYVARHIPPDQVIYPHVRGVSHELSPANANGRALRALYLGAITVDKHPDEAVSAVSLALDEGVNIELQLFGDGVAADIDSLERHIAMAGKGGRIKFLGSTSDPNEAFRNADVLLMTSRNEAFGRVTVEALLAGVPVVGYDAGATCEILRNGGGLLVPDQPEAIAEVLGKIASDPGLLQNLKEEAVRTGTRWLERGSDQEMIDVIERLGRRSTRHRGIGRG